MTDMLQKENEKFANHVNGQDLISVLSVITTHSDLRYYQNPKKADSGVTLSGVLKNVENIKNQAASENANYGTAVFKDVSWDTYSTACLGFGLCLNPSSPLSAYQQSPPVIKMGGNAEYYEDYIYNSLVDWVELTI